MVSVISFLQRSVVCKKVCSQSCQPDQEGENILDHKMEEKKKKKLKLTKGGVWRPATDKKTNCDHHPDHASEVFQCGLTNK